MDIEQTQLPEDRPGTGDDTVPVRAPLATVLPAPCVGPCVNTCAAQGKSTPRPATIPADGPFRTTDATGA